MNRIATLAALSLIVAGCTKKPDPPMAEPAPAPTAPGQPVTPPPQQPPPVTNCTGATVVYDMPVDTIPDNSIKSFVIAGLELSCGDTVRTFFQNPGVPPGTPWTEISNTPNGASYFTVLNQTVTVHNGTGIVVNVYIEAVLK